MSKLLRSITIFALVYAAGAWATSAGGANQGGGDAGVGLNPGNTKIIVLPYTNLGDTTHDSLAAGKAQVYGPFMMSMNRDRAAFTYLRFHYPLSCLDGGDSIIVSYQLLPTSLMKDTIATWTAIDTAIVGKGWGNQVTLSTSGGASIAFKITNMDATGIKIQAPIRCLFTSSLTNMVQTNR